MIIILKFLYLIYYAQFSIKFSLLFLLPHVYFLIYYGFNYEIKFLNYVLFTNNFIKSNSHLISKFMTRQQNPTFQSSTTTMPLEERSVFKKIYLFFKNIPQTSHIQIQKVSLFASHTNTTYSSSSLTITATAQLLNQSGSGTTTTTTTTPGNVPLTPNSISNTSLSSLLHFLSTLKHNCVKDTISLRDETEIFSKVFNSRFKEICMRTFEIVFYNLIITRLCVPEYINTRNFEFYSYVFILITSTFIAYWLYYVPMSSLISLNRNAEHLGEWKEYFMDNSLFESSTMANNDKASSTSPASSSPSNICCWFDTKFYFKGDSISFMGKYYRVESKFCISIPDYGLHKRFYNYFIDPFRIITILAVLKLSCIVLLGLVTYYEAKWYNIAVNMLYVIFNFHILYILTRDWIILYVKKYAKLHSE